jgi:hypothetical protein
VLVVVEAEELDDIPGTVFWLRKSPIPCHVMNIEFSLGLAQAHLPASGTGPGRCEVASLNCDRTQRYRAQ